MDRARRRHALGGLRLFAQLVVDQENPRYFRETKTGKTMFLTGSHCWDNRQDFGEVTFDFPEYLEFMKGHNHNFLRLWAWEQPKGWPWSSVDPDFTISPNPFARTGPGTARDGLPKFDLAKFNQAYFDRLRERVIAARQNS